MNTPRPKYCDTGVVAVAVELLAQHVREWMGNDYPNDDANLLSDLREATAHETDGYQIAQNLERSGWDGINTELVEILDSAWDHRSEARDAAVKAWLPTSGLTPKRSIGDTVMVDDHQGEVVSIDTVLGQYGVRIPALGHVAPGQIGTQARILDWEVLDGTSEGRNAP